MSVDYVTVSWNRSKRLYDAAMIAFALIYLAVFFIIAKVAFPAPGSLADEVLAIRALGSLAIILLHITLAIGPAARLWPALLPLLYNRRHLGVLTFFVALAHAGLSTIYYHGFGNANPIVSLLATAEQTVSLATLPYQLFGAAALVILFFMAATSHDFWLKNLSQRVWKNLHMLVYVAYALLIAHVAFGAMQVERATLPTVLVIAGAASLIVLHIVAGARERRIDQSPAPAAADHWLDAGDLATIPDTRARIILAPGGERIAVFRQGDTASALTNVCAHQGGPLGEGKIIDGCVTCPWHGFQFNPETGCSPPPFTDRVRTYPVRITAGRVHVSPEPAPLAQHAAAPDTNAGATHG